MNLKSESICALVAQLVEHSLGKTGVMSPSLIEGSTIQEEF